MPTHAISVVCQRTLAGYQADFAVALRHPRVAVPRVVADEAAERRVKRFNVYRNNMHASLLETLSARFPVVQRIVGDDFFRAMGLEFIRHHPPRSPVLAAYGAELADFLQHFEPVSELGYLPDVARIEWLRSCAYHAADAETIDIAALSLIDAQLLDQVRFNMHPAIGVVISDYPIVSIWATNTHDEVVRPIGAEKAGEAAIITRPGLDVLVTPAPACAARLIEELAAGAPLSQAIETVTDIGLPFNLPQSLAVIFQSGSVAGLSMPT